MGLSAPKNRSKISADPQNTTWANNTSRFGHKILTQQGWTPGASLGATDAAHAAHYTAASSSHIRVFLKDDNLGLGAKRGSERAENFGLAGLASILGRLNGNEEDVKREEARMEEVGRRAYVAKKFGMMNFVSGGFLVGGEIKRKGEIGTATEGMVESETKDKKRKRANKEEDDSSDSSSSESDDDDDDDDQPKLKRKKKSVDLREEVAKEVAQAAISSSKSKDKKSKKDKKDKKSKKSKKHTSTSSSPSPPPTTTSEPLTEKARLKAEKRERRARKAEKKLKKALKKAAKENKNKSSSSSSSSDEDSTTVTKTTTVTQSVPVTGTSTPTTAMGLSFSAGGRHAVRQKYIRQKRAAAMDPQALKEIFMIKTPS